MNDLSGLRWLATEVLPEGALTASVPAPVLLRAHRPAAVREYVTWWIRNPDPAGTFAAKTRWLRKLPPPLLFHLLLTLGYDGLLYVTEGTVMGHLFFSVAEPRCTPSRRRSPSGPVVTATHRS